MDPRSTPISQLQAMQSQNENTVDYNDMQQNAMKVNHDQQHSYNEEPSFPQQPIVQSIRPDVADTRYQQGQAMRPAQAQNPVNNADVMKSDFAYIVVICLIVNSEAGQALFMKYAPGMFKESRPTVVGVLLNALTVAGLFTVAKNVSIKLS